MRTNELFDRISPDERLLLRAVLCRDDVARKAFRRWREGPVLADLSGEAHRLLPFLARRMEDLGPTDPVQERIRGTYRLAWVRNHLTARTTGAAVSALEGHHIPVLVLDGGALIQYYRGDWGARPSYDIDLLVRPGQVVAAYEVLVGDGWRPSGGMSADWVLSRIVPRQHSFPFTRDTDRLNLHWRVLADSRGAHADDDFWADRSEIDLADVKVGTLSPPHLLLHVLAHGARPSTGAHVQWVVDAVQLLRACGDDGLGEPLAHAARRHGIVTTVRSALEAIDDLLGEQVAAPVLKHLSATRPPMLERIATHCGSRGRANRMATLLSRYGQSDENIFLRTKDVARAWLDLEFVTRPGLFAAYVVSGRRPLVARLARMRRNTFVRTSATPTITDGDLDFTSAVTADHHAGPGWSAVDDLGLKSRGPEARLVLDLPGAWLTDLELRLDLRSADQHPREVRVRVNERTLLRVTIGPRDETGDIRVHIPATTTSRFRPMEIAFVARGRVDIRLVRLQVRSTVPSPASAPAPL